jgi:hypothetical protein
MSAGDVAVLNTKLDILIDDFKSFKQYSIGFIITIVIPFAVYFAIQIIDANMNIAVMQEKIAISNKAIKEDL